MQASESVFKGMLKVAGLPVRPSYRPSEVCALFGISSRQFSRMVCDYERHPNTGAPLDPSTLYSFMLRKERRVPYSEMVDYIQRNDTYERNNGI
ncbi:putative cytoplasmic protein [Desulfatibacillum aliphaticivorans]|uniref:Cytoplasmic protein n=1 Tax=Desulfatibacillum aliphaticivorans TaxID=218208 RepID=B8FD20_DESAL|nr:putative cytoplasmic protein [Desulfatibacillum aliphaticivorans]